MYSGNQLQEIFANQMIFDHHIHNRRYIEDMTMDTKCVLGLTFAHAFEIAYIFLRFGINFHYTV